MIKSVHKFFNPGRDDDLVEMYNKSALKHAYKRVKKITDELEELCTPEKSNGNGKGGFDEIPKAKKKN